MSYYDDWVDPNAFFPTALRQRAYERLEIRARIEDRERVNKIREEQESLVRNLLKYEGINFKHEKHNKTIIVDIDGVRYRFFPGRKRWKDVDQKTPKDGDAVTFVKTLVARHR